MRFRTLPTETLDYGFSAKADGSMSRSSGWENRQQYLQAQGLPANQLVQAGLAHNSTVALVGMVDGGKFLDGVDGLVTEQTGITLAMTAADCLLLYFYDPATHAIGLGHAGRKGLAERMPEQMVVSLASAFGSRPSDLQVGISPAICQRHYPVEPAQAVPFEAWPEAIQVIGDRAYLDLRQIAIKQLLDRGVHRERIDLDLRCTYETPELFSYRRDRPASPEVQVGWIKLRT